MKINLLLIIISVLLVTNIYCYFFKESEVIYIYEDYDVINVIQEINETTYTGCENNCTEIL